MSGVVLTAEGHRAPPSSFVKRLAKFDPNLRIVWGFGQAVPFPGWVIERRIPDAMKAKVYGGPGKDPNRERFADQWIVDEKGKTVTRRSYDMMPDWHEIYRVMDEDGNPILEVGDFIIRFLKRNYERTLLGIPELSAKHHKEDQAERAAAEEKRHDDLTTRCAEKVMDRKTEIFPESFAFSGPPRTQKEGTDLNGNPG